MAQSISEKPGNLDFKTLDLDDADQRIKAAGQLFTMVKEIVWDKNGAALREANEKKIVEKDIGHGIKAQFNEKFAQTCRIGEAVLVHHDIEDVGGMGMRFENNVAWVKLNGEIIFQAEWGWDRVNDDSIVMRTDLPAREVFALIQQTWRDFVQQHEIKDQ